MWRPVSITLSCTSLITHRLINQILQHNITTFYLKLRLTTLLKRNARPVAPVKRVLINSLRFVRKVSQAAQENRRIPPICCRNILPMLDVVLCLLGVQKSIPFLCMSCITESKPRTATQVYSIVAKRTITYGTIFILLGCEATVVRRCGVLYVAVNNVPIYQLFSQSSYFCD